MEPRDHRVQSPQNTGVQPSGPGSAQYRAQGFPSYKEGHGGAQYGGQGDTGYIEGQGGAHDIQPQGGAHDMGGQGGAHVFGGQGGAHDMGGQGGAHVFGGQGGAHDMGGQGGAHVFGGQGGAHDMGGQGGAHVFGGQGGAHDMGGQGGAHVFGGQGGAHDMGGQGGAHVFGGQGGAHDMGGQGGAHDMGGQGGAHDMGGQGGAHDMGGQGGAHDMGGQGGAHDMGGQVERQKSTVGGGLYPIYVHVPQNQEKFHLKILKYFQSKKSGGDENCKVSQINPSTYCVYFQDPKTQDRVLTMDHVIESKTVQVTRERDMKYESHHSQQSSKTSKSVDLYNKDGGGKDYRESGVSDFPEGNRQSGSHPAAGLRTDHPSSDVGTEDLSSHPLEIFTEIFASLNKHLINKEILQEIEHNFKSLKIHTSEASVKVSGSFTAIEKLYHFLQKKLGGGARRSVEEEEPEEELEDCLNLQTALYEYIADIYEEDLALIRNRYNVEVTEVRRSKGTTYIKLKPLGQGASVDRAKQIFIDKVQAVTKDWKQKEAPRSSMKVSLEDTKRYLKEHHKTSVIVEGDLLILRGPERNLTPAIEALQRGEGRSLLPRRVITITSKDNRNEVIVDARHLDMLRRLKFRKLEELQQKFRVKMDEDQKGSNVKITFRTMNGSPDLGAHACHSFTNLLQTTIMNLLRKTISGNFDEGRLAEFSTKLRKDGLDVILEHDKGSVTLIASPILVDVSEEKLLQFLKIKGVGEATASGGNMKQEAMDTGKPADTKTNTEEEPCPICLDQIKNKKVLKCKHEFCDTCLQKSSEVKPVCPVCAVPFGVVIGNQPDGTMTHTTARNSLPGYPECGTITILYNIPGGIQQENHPHPGTRFSGTSRTAYLPDNREGKEVLRLLKKAFDQKLIFTVGESRTSSAKNTVTWNDIHHKTSTAGGTTGFGYPDPDYLRRVRDELKAKGIE